MTEIIYEEFANCVVKRDVRQLLAQKLRELDIHHWLLSEFIVSRQGDYWYDVFNNFGGAWTEVYNANLTFDDPIRRVAPGLTHATPWSDFYYQDPFFFLYAGSFLLRSGLVIPVRLHNRAWVLSVAHVNAKHRFSCSAIIRLTSLTQSAAQRYSEIVSHTRQQERVLFYFGQSLSIKEIAEKMKIKPVTVNFHLNAASERSHVGRKALRSYAVRSTLIEHGDERKIFLRSPAIIMPT